MKELGFAPHLIPLVLNGSKTVTWRFFDDKNITAGEFVTCVHQFTRQPNAKLIITSVVRKKLKNIDDLDRKGHEEIGDIIDILSQYKKYYSRDITLEDEVKIIRFEVCD
ncbi:MAG: ASCH domain-containing protein [Candidatus Roizmanbacteria bacterium]